MATTARPAPRIAALAALAVATSSGGTLKTKEGELADVRPRAGLARWELTLGWRRVALHLGPAPAP